MPDIDHFDLAGMRDVIDGSELSQMDIYNMIQRRNQMQSDLLSNNLHPMNVLNNNFNMVYGGTQNPNYFTNPVQMPMGENGNMNNMPQPQNERIKKRFSQQQNTTTNPNSGSNPPSSNTQQPNSQAPTGNINNAQQNGSSNPRIVLNMSQFQNIPQNQVQQSSHNSNIVNSQSNSSQPQRKEEKKTSNTNVNPNSQNGKKK